MNSVKEKNNSEDLHYLYRVLDKAIQNEFSEYCQQNLNIVSSYLKFIADNDLVVASEEKFGNMIKQINLGVNNENAHCCWQLAKIRKNESNSNVHSVIDDYASKNECLKFYLSPFEYKEKKNVIPEWLLVVDQDTIHKLVEVEEYKSALKKYLKDNPFISHRQRMMIIDVL